MNKILSLLSMCARAGKIKMGTDAVKEACVSGKAFGVYAADDISQKSLKEAKFICQKTCVKLYSLEASMEEVGNQMGKRVGIIAVLDSGFNKKAASLALEIATDKI